MFIFEKSVIIKCPIRKVFEFHTDIENLQLLSRFRGMRVKLKKVNLPIWKGSEVLLSITHFGIIKLRWYLHVEEFDSPNKFVDIMLKGPFKTWKHTHQFIDMEDSTKMIDRIDYEMPLGFLGKLAHNLFVKRHINSLFEFRHRLTKEILE